MADKFRIKSRRSLIEILALIIIVGLMSLAGCSSKEPTAQDAPTAQNAPTAQDDLAKYISLLGLDKAKLISTLQETPTSIDEGGLEFAENGIKVWFDQATYTVTDQIFIMKKDIDLNGAKIGDKISKFKEVFGDPVSDKNGDAHFKYRGIFISINYDTSTQETVAVYILKTDF